MTETTDAKPLNGQGKEFFRVTPDITASQLFDYVVQLSQKQIGGFVEELLTG